MKKYFIVLLGGFSLMLWGCASSHQSVPADKADKGGGGFRGSAWGTDKAEVEKGEKTGSLVAGSPADELVYDGELLGKISVKITYHFEDGKLRRGTYQVVRPESVMEYTLFQIILSRKYGRPYQDAETSEMVEANWLTPDTEIDLLADGNQMESYSLKNPEVSRAVELTALKVNYYDRAWFARSISKSDKKEANLNESETFYQKLIGDWVQEYPSYRSCIGYDPYLFPGDPTLLPADEYVYEPGSSESDF
ncbi:MAG TPA: hypothetical protein ENH12_05110 [Proteobacteria bacterium]|nr:hypothetical protein [Pseudomonadota bacterium]